MSTARARFAAVLAEAALASGPPAGTGTNNARWHEWIVEFFWTWFDARPPELEDFSPLLALLRQFLPTLTVQEIAVLQSLFGRFRRSPAHRSAYLALLEEIAAQGRSGN
jgi:hypothetical protein